MWELIETIWDTIRLKNIVEKGADVVAWFYGLIDQYLPAEIDQPLSDFGNWIGGMPGQAMFRIVGWLMDFVVDVIVVEAIMTSMIVFYAVMLIIRFVLWVYVKVWGAV